MTIAPLPVTAYTLTCALGRGVGATLTALREMRGSLCRCDLPDADLDTWIGRVEGLENARLRGPLADYDCRNNRLADLALAQDGFDRRVAEAVERLGSRRVGLFVGTSTSGLRHTELWYRGIFAPEIGGSVRDLRYRYTHSNFSLAAFCRGRLGLNGPVVAVSTACSSSAKVFAAAHRYVAAGFCDAAVVGGVDTLCATTLMGFHSLGLISPVPCTPWGLGRQGINIGEGAGFVLLEADPQREVDTALLGYGESSDAYHISSPHPQGIGAALAISTALASAGLTNGDIDYINLHGTGTPANDVSEDKAVTSILGNEVAASATKGWTAHTLGASGAIEAVIALSCLEAGLIPGTLGTQTLDPQLSLPVVSSSRPASLRRVLSNSFGFGGSNCSLIFGRGA
jgi:3-oxoacyl-[acyl-carrier-protein] synthase-1